MAYGSVLTVAEDSVVDRKARGAFFTPKVIAERISRFAIRSRDDAVLEPACGEAEFLLVAGRRLLELGSSSQNVSALLEGVELHEMSAHAAARRLGAHGLAPAIHVTDFFLIDNLGRRFDAVIGNPPYIRFQSFGGAQRSRALASARRMGVSLSGLSSSWAPFVIHATSFLKKGGRLALVLPAELLTANYASEVRAYLLQKFPQINLLLFEDQVFPEAQEEVLLLLADGFEVGRSTSVTISSFSSYQEPGAHGVEGARVYVRDGERWPRGDAGNKAQRLVASLPCDTFGILSDWGTVRLGAVTGANGYFAISKNDAEAWGLGRQDIVPLCPPGSRHLRGLSMTADDMERLAAEGEKTFLFLPQGEKNAADLTEAARAYVIYGEQTGVNKGYKCRTRSPWWRVPVAPTADFLLTYMNGYGPSICRNDAGAYHLNSVHGLYLDESVVEKSRDLLPLASCSTPFLLSAELRGRAYGGGVLKVEPREARGLVVPLPGASDLFAIDSGLFGRTKRLLDLGERERATSLVDRALLHAGAVDAEQLSEMQNVLGYLRTMRERRGGRQ